MLKCAREDLLRSGISVDEAELAEMFSTKDASEYNEDFKPVPAIVIPYIDPWTDDYVKYKNSDGRKHDFCRVRYLDELEPQRGFTKVKPIRYSQPKHSGVHAYFPVVDLFDWADVIDDVSMPILFTEGEKKALASCLMGVPTIGLGGVYNFSEHGKFLPVLDKIEFTNRMVTICYDSDANSNPMVKMAEDRLAVELSVKRGARLHMIRLPEGPEGEKWGLDDYIVNEGDDAFDNLVDTARPMRAMDKEILKMNEQVAYIEDEGILVELETGILIKKESFKEGSKYSAVKIITQDAKGKVDVQQVAKAWLSHENAKRYSTMLFQPATVSPTVQTESGVAYNLYHGLHGTEGDVTPFFDLYDHMMSTTDEFDHDLIWKIIAWKVQNLAERPNLGIMMLGVQGSGKTLFTDIVSSIFEPYSVALATKDLGSEYNAWIEKSFCIVMNEAKATQLKFNMDVLKGYVTDAKHARKEKYLRNKQVINYGMYFFNSNQRSAGAFEDDDRRMIIMKAPKKHPSGRKFYAPIFKWHRAGGAKHLLSWLQSYDLEGWEPPIQAPETREKRMAYYASLTPVQKLANQIKTASTSIVEMWVKGSLEWANNILNGNSMSSTQQMIAAQNVDEALSHMTIRPFYTPEELIKLFAPLAEEFAYGKVKNMTSGDLSKQLMQEGIEYLKCKDNYDGFKHDGMIRQFLVIADHDNWDEPILQKDFTRMMRNDFPSYADITKARREEARKAKRENKRNKEA